MLTRKVSVLLYRNFTYLPMPARNSLKLGQKQYHNQFIIITNIYINQLEGLINCDWVDQIQGLLPLTSSKYVSNIQI